MPKPLMQALFEPFRSDSDKTGPTTFAILDAAVNPFVPEILATTDVPHRSLYSGEAEAEFADTAPWLVQLDPADRFLPSLFVAGDTPWQLWGNGLGMLLRAPVTFEDMRQHLRHFIKTQDAKGNWYFFRFWEPATCAAFFQNLHEDAQNYARWRKIDTDQAIASVFVPTVADGLREIPFDPVQSDAPKGGFVLRDADVARMGQAARLHVDVALAAFAIQAADPLWPKQDQARSAALSFAQRVRAQTETMGITSPTDQERMVRLSRLYGLEFYHDPRLPRPEATVSPTQTMYAILDQRILIANMLQGHQSAGGLAADFLKTDGNKSDFDAALQCPLPADKARAFYSTMDHIDIALPTTLKIWLGFYLGHRFAQDARYTHVMRIAQHDPAFDPQALAAWVCNNIDQDPIGRPQ